MPAMAVGTARMAAQDASLRVVSFCAAWPIIRLASNAKASASRKELNSSSTRSTRSATSPK